MTLVWIVMLPIFIVVVFGGIIVGIAVLIATDKKLFRLPYVLTLSCESEAAEKAALVYVSQNTKSNVVKTKTVTRDHIEVTSEIRLKNAGTAFVNELVKIRGVSNVSLVCDSGERIA